MNIECITIEIAKLQVQPDECLLVRLPHVVSAEQGQILARQIRDLWPGIRVMVFSSSIEFSVVKMHASN